LKLKALLDVVIVAKMEDRFHLFFTKTIFMKSAKGPQVRGKNMNPETMKKRPEVRDNLDHREGEEQDDKGDIVTHNKKEHHTPPKKK
jgi:hypothetical protein